MRAKQPPSSVPELGQRLRYFRRQRRRGEGGTLREFAAACGLSVSFVSLVERGEREPQLRTLVAMAQALGVPIRELFTPLPTGPDAPQESQEAALQCLVHFIRARGLSAESILKLLRLAESAYPPPPLRHAHPLGALPPPEVERG